MTILTAPTVSTRIPTDRNLEGLEYGASHNGRRYVRPTGMTLWGLARELPGENLPDDATTLDELTAELDRWDHLALDFHPAVAVLLDDGGIRAASEAEEYQAVLAAWAWERLLVRLAEYGARPEGTLAGRHVRAALEACHPAPATEQAIERVARDSIAGVEALGGPEEAPEAVRKEAGLRIKRARRHLGRAHSALEGAPVRRDESFEDLRDRLVEALAQLRALEASASTLTAEELLNGLAGVRQLVDPVWVRASTLQEATVPVEAEVAGAVPA